MHQQAHIQTAVTSRSSAINAFDSEAFEVDQRLAAFETFAFGDTIGYRGQPRLLSLSASNANYNRDLRLQRNDIRASVLLTSGYTARACQDPKSNPNTFLFITECLSGGATLRTQRSQDTLAEGDICINLARDYEVACCQGEYRRVILPKQHLGSITTDPDAILFFRRHDPISRVLQSAIESVASGLQSAHDEQARTIEELMVSILRRILEDARASTHRAGHNHIRDRAMEYIRDNLHRADLSIVEIANYVHVSRATLYRAFENVGGLKEFVTSERIARAKSMLRQGRTDRGIVTSVAHRTGFAAPEQFSKVFKAHTGISPTEYVKSGVL